jgi:hypothetical protein
MVQYSAVPIIPVDACFGIGVRQRAGAPRHPRCGREKEVQRQKQR